MAMAKVPRTEVVRDLTRARRFLDCFTAAKLKMF